MQLRPDCVELVDPWRQLIVVTLPRRKPVVSPAVRNLGRGARASKARTTALASRVPPATARVARAVAWLAPRVLFVAELGLWLYAVVVFALVRVAWLVLAALTIGTVRGGARLKPHLHGRPARI